MKKTIIFAALTFTSIAGFAQQALEDQLRDANCKAAETAVNNALKGTENPKKNIKGSTWVKLAEAYAESATNCGRDSLASKKAYETYKKALEVDAATGGGKEKADIEKALKDQKLFNALLSQGAALYNNQSLDNALVLFKLANEVNPTDTTTALYAGIVAQQNKDLATAKEYFKKFLDNKGKDPAVFYSLAVILRNDKDFDGAEAVLKKGIETHPTDKDLKTELVNNYIVSNRLDKAIADLEKLVEADPSNLANISNLAIIYDNSKNKEKALEYYKKALALEPNNYDVNYNVAAMYFNDAVEIKKTVDAMDIKTYQKEGKAVEQKVCAKFAEAKPYFEACLAARPNDEDVKINIETIDKIVAQCK